ncbi:MAG TPA: FISUMP domain-containing protein [Prolixibacteraceae bacterium]|nr:FISUMP domain-containing protein [Prolixibacteraceae bacterium]
MSSCKKDEDPLLIITDEPRNVGSTTALSGGTIVWEDGSAITGRGICWGTKQNPTIEDNKTANGKGPGNFESSLKGLLPNTSYYIRTYVIKSGRVIYGNLESFKTKDVLIDIDGNIYNTITIGNQLWMAENLRTTRFVNGDLIGTTTPATLSIMNFPDPVYQWPYNGLESNAAKYGRLYTWYAVMDPRGLCPEGWHIPSDAEWTQLENYLIYNNYNYDGTTSGNKVALALASATGWKQSEYSGSPGNANYADFHNKSRFSALPGGYRNNEGRFANLGTSGCWWSRSEESPYFAYYRYLLSNLPNLSRSSYYEFCGISVRCIKD